MTQNGEDMTMFVKFFRPRSLAIQAVWPPDVLVEILVRDTLDPVTPTDLIWWVKTLEGFMPLYDGRAAACELFDTQESGIQLERLHLERRARHLSQLAEMYVKGNGWERSIRKDCHAKIFGWLDLCSQLDTLKFCQELASFSSDNSAMLLTVFINRLAEWRAGKDL